MTESLRVPLLDLKPQYDPIRDEVRRAIDEVIESQYFILGPKGRDLEAQIAVDGEAEPWRSRRTPGSAGRGQRSGG